jgi:alkylated DNA repair dioxygenase AlkB
MQLTLFDIAQPLPQGFSYFPEFISSEEEASLIKIIEQLELHAFTFQGHTAKRKTVSFGSFEKEDLSKRKDIPATFHPLIQKIAARIDLPPAAFTELLVTEYPPGSVINWHRDAPPFDLIAGISLQSDCTFRLRPYEKKKQHRRAIISFPVERRSLYIMQGPARTDWQHSISPVQNLRYSITLRTVKS